MNRVVHISSAHNWTDNRVHLREAATLVEAGYEVHLVAVVHDVDIPHTGVIPHLIPRRARGQRLLLSVPQALWLGLRTKALIVHLHDPELVLAIPLLRALGRKVIYDAHEDLPAQVERKQYLSSWMMPIMQMLARWLTRFAGRSASAVVAATEAVAERFPADKVRIVHNYPRLRAADDATGSLAQRENRSIYIGVLNVPRGAVDMVEAVLHPNAPVDWDLDLAGVLEPASLLAELSEMPEWDRVKYHGVLGPSEARDLLLSAKVGIVVAHDNEAARDSYPTKLFEYMAAGLAVVASDFPLWRQWVADNDAGLMVPDRDPGALAAALARYAADPEMLERHGDNGRRAVLERYNWDAAAVELLAVYSELNRASE